MRKDVKVKNILASLHDLGRLVEQKTSDEKEDLQQTRLLIQRAFEFDLFSIYQYDYLEKKLVPIYLFGNPFNLVDAVNFRLGKGATGWSLSHRKSLLMKSLGRNGKPGRFFVNSFMCVPIMINAQIVGMLVMGSFHEGKYDESDRFLLETLTPYLGGLLLKNYFNFEKEIIT